MTDYISKVTYNQNTPDGAFKEQRLGRLTLLLGNNGSGKSAIIKAIMTAATGASYDVASQKASGANGFAMLTGVQSNKLVNEVHTAQGYTSKVVVSYSGTVQSPAVAQSIGCPQFVFPVPVLEEDAVSSTAGAAVEQRLLRWHGTSPAQVVAAVSKEAVQEFNNSKATSLEEFGKWLKSQKKSAKAARDTLQGQMERGRPGGVEDSGPLEERLKEAELAYQKALKWEAYQELVASQVTEADIAEVNAVLEEVYASLADLEECLSKWRQYETDLQSELQEATRAYQWHRDLLDVVERYSSDVGDFPFSEGLDKTIAGLSEIVACLQDAENLSDIREGLTSAGAEISSLLQERDTLLKRRQENSQLLVNYDATIQKLEESAPEVSELTVAQAEQLVTSFRKEVDEMTHFRGVALRNANRQKAIDKKHARFTLLDDMQGKLKAVLKETVGRVQEEIEAGISAYLPEGWQYKILSRHLGRQCFLRCLKKGDGPWAYDPSGAEGVALLVAESLYVASRAAKGAVTVVIPPDKGWDPSTLRAVMEAVAAQQSPVQVILQSTVPPSQPVSGWNVVDLSPESRKKTHELVVSFGPGEFFQEDVDMAQLAELGKLQKIGPGGKWPEEVAEVLTEQLEEEPEVSAFDKAYYLSYAEEYGLKELKKVYRKEVGGSVKREWKAETLAELLEDHHLQAGRERDAKEAVHRLYELSVGELSYLKVMDALLHPADERHIQEVAYFLQANMDAPKQSRTALRKRVMAADEDTNLDSIHTKLAPSNRDRLMMEALGYPEEVVAAMSLRIMYDTVEEEVVYEAG